VATAGVWKGQYGSDGGSLKGKYFGDGGRLEGGCDSVRVAAAMGWRGGKTVSWLNVG
jgi:hypothetical protein